MEIELPRFYGNNLTAYRCHDPEVILAGPADTGKTLTILTKLHYLAHKHKDASIVIARKQQTDMYATVLASFEDLLLKYDPSVLPYGGEKAQWYDYPSGARIWVAGLDKAGKVLSGQHDAIYVNQCEEISLADWETLTTRTTGRAGHIPYPQTIGDANPGPPTHWIRQRARDKAVTFIESTHKDNPDLYDQRTGKITEQGKQRIGNLKRLSGARYQRLYLGLWAAPEGMIYEHFDEAKHVVKAKVLPVHWPRFIGIDPVGEQIAAIWVAWDNQNQVLNVYREYMQPFGVTTPQHRRTIERMSQGEMILAWIGGGPSERQQRADWGGLQEPGITDVWSGIDRINSLLKDGGIVIHDCCQNLLSEIGEYRRATDRDGTVTDKIQDKERFHCLTGDTLVLTRSGECPIWQIQPEVEVLTRRGWRRVLDSACTNQAAMVYCVELSNGQSLTGTGDHPVWVRGRGYTDLRALQYGDIMVTSEEVLPCQDEENDSGLGCMGIPGAAIQIQTTTETDTFVLSSSFINTCGRLTTARLPRDSRYTTLMAMLQTMTSKIWPYCQCRNIEVCTHKQKKQSSACGTFNRKDKKHQRDGIEVQRGGRGIESLAYYPGKAENLSSRSAPSVERNSRRWTGRTIPASALPDVGLGQDTSLAWMMRRELVSAAGANSYATSTTRRSFAPVRVLRVIPLNKKRPVYNLEVEGAHEFFANGILVHNCLDALRYVVAWLSRPHERVEVVDRLANIGGQW